MKNKNILVVFQTTLLAIFLITFPHTVKSIEAGTNDISLQNHHLQITFFALDNHFPDIGTNVNLEIIVESLAVGKARVEYYLSLDADVSTDDVQLGSQLLIFDENNVSINKKVQLVILNQLAEKPFYFGACVVAPASPAEAGKAHCTQGVMVELVPSIPNNLPAKTSKENVDIDWLNGVQLLSI